MWNLSPILISQDMILDSKNLEDSLVIPLWLHDVLALALLPWFPYKHLSCRPFMK